MFSLQTILISNIMYSARVESCTILSSMSQLDFSPEHVLFELKKQKQIRLVIDIGGIKISSWDLGGADCYTEYYM
jgi:hypothetical protein